ncbi:cytochrome b562 [Bibersteinia trehalosi]|uniref:cytochrome b562 n=1 Tax=Bibersteinia trehalosi TaxID=47735 RepID=UPI00404545A5
MMKLRQLFALLMLGLASFASANVSMEMFQMNRQVGGLINATSVEAFQQSATDFVKAANEAREKMPRSLIDEPERFEGYQKAMDEVIDIVMAAYELAGQGKLDEAKALASKLNQLKKQYHTEYK